jgi:hypothetical protein
LSIRVGVLAVHGAAVVLWLALERHHRHVARWLQPRFERALRPRGAAVRVPTPPTTAYP